MIIDTKWKRIGRHPEDTRHGMSQTDVYQMMAYARIYHCPQVMLLYPHHAGLGTQPLNVSYRILAGEEQLQVASVDLIPDEAAIVEQLIHHIRINTQRGGIGIP